MRNVKTPPRWIVRLAHPTGAELFLRPEGMVIARDVAAQFHVKANAEASAQNIRDAAARFGYQDYVVSVEAA